MGKIAENGLRPPQTGIWQDFLVGVVMLWKPGAGYPCKTKRMRKVGTVNWFSFFHGLATVHALFVIRK